MKSLNKSFKNKELLIGLIMIVAVLPFLLETKLEYNPLYLVPYIAITIMILSGLSVVLKALRTKEFTAKKENVDKISFLEIILIIAFLLGSVIFLDKLGFYATLFIVVFAINIYLGKRNYNKINWLKSFLFTIVTIGVTFYVFDVLLSVRVPSEVWLF